MFATTMLFAGLSVLLLINIFFAVQFFNILFRGYAPFVSSNPEVIRQILEEINLSENDKVYELGCGKAGFLHALSEKYPKVEVIGVENSPLPYLIAKIQKAFKRDKIKIKFKNLFKTNITDADLVYCYLNIKTMKRLKEKFEKECKPGAKIVSYTFEIPGFKPEKVIEAGSNKIYFYTI